MSDKTEELWDDLHSIAEKYKHEFKPPGFAAMLIHFCAFILKDSAPDKTHLKNFWEMMLQKVDEINNRVEE